MHRRCPDLQKHALCSTCNQLRGQGQDLPAGKAAWRPKATQTGSTYSYRLRSHRRRASKAAAARQQRHPWLTSPSSSASLAACHWGGGTAGCCPGVWTDAGVCVTAPLQAAWLLWSSSIAAAAAIQHLQLPLRSKLAPSRLLWASGCMLCMLNPEHAGEHTCDPLHAKHAHNRRQVGVDGRSHVRVRLHQLQGHQLAHSADALVGACSSRPADLRQHAGLAMAVQLFRCLHK